MWRRRADQPAAQSGHGIRGAAALAKPDPGRGVPIEFIPIAEDIGIIGTIGDWVVRTACLEAASWPNAYTVSVNVSAIQFRTPNLVAAIMSALAESGLDPRRLELEITESVMLDAGGTAFEMLKTLRGLGVRVALDVASDIRRWGTCAAFHSTGSRSINPSFAARPMISLAGRLSVRWSGSVKVSAWRRWRQGLKPRSSWHGSWPKAAPRPRASCSAARCRPNRSAITFCRENGEGARAGRDARDLKRITEAVHARLPTRLLVSDRCHSPWNFSEVSQ
jgi:hypothetical protein